MSLLICIKFLFKYVKVVFKLSYSTSLLSFVSESQMKIFIYPYDIDYGIQLRHAGLEKQLRTSVMVAIWQIIGNEYTLFTSKG